MSFFAYSNDLVVPQRRSFLGSAALLSGAAVALLAGRDSLAAEESRGAKAEANDARFLA